MDKSFTSLTYKKGPSKQECSRFIAKFKSVVLVNWEVEQQKMDAQNKRKREHHMDQQNQEEHEYKRDQQNQEKYGPKNVKKEVNSKTTGEKTSDSPKPIFLAYKIKIDDEYIITIKNQGCKLKSEYPIPTKPDESPKSEQAKRRERINPESSTNKTTLSLSTSEETLRKANNKVRINESNDIEAAKHELNVKRTEETSYKATVDTAEVNEYQFVNNSDNILTQRLTLLEEQSSEFIGSIRIQPNVEISLSKTIGPKEREAKRTSKRREAKTEEIEIKRADSLTLPTDKENTKAVEDEDVNRIASSRSKNISVSYSSSLTDDNHPFRFVKQELSELLQMASMMGISSESLFRVLCNILEELNTMNPVPRTSADLQTCPFSEDSRETPSWEECEGRNDDNAVHLSDNYYIVNIEQIKSMAQITDRINRVVSTLLKCCNALKLEPIEGETAKANFQKEDIRGIPTTSENKDSTSNTEDTSKRSEESTSTMSEDLRGKEYTINVVEIAEAPFDLGTNQSTNTGSSLPSIDPLSFVTDSLRSSSDSMFSSTIPESENTFGSYAVHHLNSFGSQTSCTDLELSNVKHPTTYHKLGNLQHHTIQSDGSGMLFKRKTEHAVQRENSLPSDESEWIFKQKRSRFRASQSRGSDTINITGELLALLDNVEKLLINNCADRYEMMILLEQIFSEYARSAQKAVADLKKFIVTFNKNNSYL